MITLNFSVDDQLLTRTDENTVAANSHLVHVCEFAFSSEWDGRGKVATFKKRDLMFSVILDDNACTIPPEILQSENKIDVFELSVCGADGNSTITSTVVKVPILAGTWDVMSTEITPTMFEQIMQKIDEVEKGEVSPELIYEAVSEYMEAHPLEPIVAEDVAAYFVEHAEELKGPKGDTGATPAITATAEVNNAVGTPNVTVTKTGTAEAPNLNFVFQNLKGVKGDNGATPTISAAATVDNTTGTPAVNVTKTGTDAAPEFTFEFSGLKGAKGDPGEPGDVNTQQLETAKADVNNIVDNTCGYVLGAVSSNGTIDDTIRNRIRFTDYEYVRKGSTVSVDSSDYKFNLATYSQNNSSSLLEFFPMRIGDNPITITQDCYIRASIGKVTNEEFLNTNEAAHFKLKLIRDYAIEITTERYNERAYLKNIYFAPIVNEDARLTTTDSAFSTFSENSTATDISNFIETAIAAKVAEDETVAVGYGYAHKVGMGNDASGQYPLYYYVCEAPTGNGGRDKLKPAFVIVAGQHGDEKVSQFACAHLIDVLTNKWKENAVLEWLHWNAVLYIMPSANPWGTTNGRYENSNGVNINRNWLYEFTPDLTPGSDYTGTQPMTELETLAIRNMINNIRAQHNLVHIIDFHTNKDTLDSPQWNMVNWLSMIAIDGAIDKDLDNVLNFHGYKLSNQFKEEYSLTLPDAKKLFYISSNDGANMLKGYGQGLLHIPALTLECCAKLPEGAAYSPTVIKMATETIVNWVYNVCLEMSRYTG